MNFSNFSKKFFKSFTRGNMNRMNVIKNNFRRSFLFNKVQLINIYFLQKSTLIKNSLPFCSQNSIFNTDTIDTESKIQNLLEGNRYNNYN